MNKVDKLLSKIDRFFTEDLQKSVANVFITQESDGSINLFDKYLIQSNDKKYKVSLKTTHTTKEFINIKHAITWCVFDYRNKILECNDIETLDKYLGFCNYQIFLHKQLISSVTEKENKLIYYSKLTNEEHKKAVLLKKISNYITDSINWQNKQFNKKSQF